MRIKSKEGGKKAMTMWIPIISRISSTAENSKNFSVNGNDSQTTQNGLHTRIKARAYQSLTNILERGTLVILYILFL